MDASQISGLVDEYGKSIYNFCLKLTLSRYDAEELYQQVFEKVSKNIDKIDEKNNPKSFLIGLSISVWRNYKRKQWRHGLIAPIVHITGDTEIATDENVEDVVSENEEKACIKDIIIKLPEKLKIPIILYYNFGMSMEETGEFCKCPVGTIKSRLYKARNIIKNELEARGYED